MAELIIRLEIDPNTQKKNIIIKYLSDDDALPMEHEEAHRAIVDQLIEGGAVAASEVGEVTIERLDDVSIPLPQSKEEEDDEGLEQEA